MVHTRVPCFLQPGPLTDVSGLGFRMARTELAARLRWRQQGGEVSLRTLRRHKTIPKLSKP